MCFSRKMAVVKKLPSGAYSVYWSLSDYWDRIGRGLDTSGSTEFECEGRVGIHKLEFEFKASESVLSLKHYGKGKNGIFLKT
jgi:hypothetical protein